MLLCSQTKNAKKKLNQHDNYHMAERTHLLLQFACSLVTQSKVRKQFPLYSTISICIPLLNTAGFFGQIRFFLFCYVGSSQCSVTPFWEHCAFAIASPGLLLPSSWLEARLASKLSWERQAPGLGYT